MRLASWAMARTPGPRDRQHRQPEHEVRHCVEHGAREHQPRPGWAAAPIDQRQAEQHLARRPGPPGLGAGVVEQEERLRRGDAQQHPAPRRVAHPRHEERERDGHGHGRDHQVVDQPREQAPAERGRCRRCRAVRLERPGHGVVAGVAILGLLGETAEDDAAQADRHAGRDPVRRRRRVVGHRHQQRHQIRRGERPAAGDQLVERRAEAVDVGARVEGRAAQLLRRGVGRRRRQLVARRERGLLRRPHRSRDAEVTDLDDAVGVDEAVRRLDVAVQDAGLAGRLQAGHQLQRHVDGGGRRQRSTGRQAIGQRALHQLHRDRRDAVDLGRAEDEHAVLVIDRRGQAAFALEALAFALVAEALLEHLERHPAAALDFLRFVDDAHAAAPEDPRDPVAAEGRVGRERGRPRRWPRTGVGARRRGRQEGGRALLQKAGGVRRLVIAQQPGDVVGQAGIARPQRRQGGSPLPGIPSEHAVQFARRRMPPFCIPRRHVPPPVWKSGKAGANPTGRRRLRAISRGARRTAAPRAGRSAPSPSRAGRSDR